jgi:hypothetical protein
VHVWRCRSAHPGPRKKINANTVGRRVQRQKGGNVFRCSLGSRVAEEQEWSRASRTNPRAGGVGGTSPSVNVQSWVVRLCACIGVGIGGKDGPALFDLGAAACNGKTPVFWCRSGVALVSPLGRRGNGFPIANWGLVARRCVFARPCTMVAHSVKASGRSKC